MSPIIKRIFTWQKCMRTFQRLWVCLIITSIRWIPNHINTEKKMLLLHRSVICSYSFFYEQLPFKIRKPSVVFYITNNFKCIQFQQLFKKNLHWHQVYHILQQDPYPTNVLLNSLHSFSNLGKLCTKNYASNFFGNFTAVFNIFS